MNATEEAKLREKRRVKVRTMIEKADADAGVLEEEARVLWNELFPRLNTAFFYEVRDKRDVIDSKRREAEKLRTRANKLRVEEKGLHG